jgi:hypothetical protein
VGLTAKQKELQVCRDDTCLGPCWGPLIASDGSFGGLWFGGNSVSVTHVVCVGVACTHSTVAMLMDMMCMGFCSSADVTVVEFAVLLCWASPLMLCLCVVCRACWTSWLPWSPT